MNVKNIIILILLAEGIFLATSYVSEQKAVVAYPEHRANTFEARLGVEDEMREEEESIPQNIIVSEPVVFEEPEEEKTGSSTDCAELFEIIFHETGSERLIKVENGFIDLSNKRLKKMPDDIIYEDCISAINAKLNKLEELPDELVELPNLTFLDLSYNRIKVLHDLKKLHRLKHIDLSYNDIKKIPIDIMALKELEYLNLRGNYQIQKIPYLIVHLNRFLKKLDIRNTQLSLDRREVNELKKLLPNTTILYK